MKDRKKERKKKEADKNRHGETDIYRQRERVGGRVDNAGFEKHKDEVFFSHCGRGISFTY